MDKILTKILKDNNYEKGEKLGKGGFGLAYEVKKK